MKAFRTANENDLGKRRRLHKYGGDFLMRPFIRSLYRAGLIGGTALALSLVPTNARGQQSQRQANASAKPGRFRTAECGRSQLLIGWTNFLTITRISTRTFEKIHP